MYGKFIFGALKNGLLQTFLGQRFSDCMHPETAAFCNLVSQSHADAMQYIFVCPSSMSASLDHVITYLRRSGGHKLPGWSQHKEEAENLSQGAVSWRVNL